MAKFVPFDFKTEVSGKVMNYFINVIPENKGLFLVFLSQHGLTDIQMDEWYKQESWLKALKEIENYFGGYTLYYLGKSISKMITLDSGVDCLKEALSSINETYQSHHRNGNTGEYLLEEFNTEFNTARIVVNTPYPCDMVRGIVTAVARKYQPQGSRLIEVIPVETPENRNKNPDACVFEIRW